MSRKTSRRAKHNLTSVRALLIASLRQSSPMIWAILGTLAAFAITSAPRGGSPASAERDGDSLWAFFQASQSTSQPDSPEGETLAEDSDLETRDRQSPKAIASSPPKTQPKAEDSSRNKKSSFYSFPLTNKNNDRGDRAQSSPRRSRSASNSPSPRRNTRENAALNPREIFRANSQPATPRNSQPRSDRLASINAEVNPIPFTLQDVVNLTVANNTAIKNAYLDRIVQQAELATEQGEFDPKLTPTVRGQVLGDGRNWNITDSRGRIELGAGISLLIPTGGRFQLDWTSETNSRASTITGDAPRQGLNLRFRQPLLRDAGTAITRSNLEIAKRQDKIGILNLQETLINEITRAIEIYRRLLGLQEQVINTRAALDNAKQQLERQQALIEAGRAARYTLLGSQQNVTEFESQLIEAQNAVKSAQLALRNQLGIEEELNIVAVEDVLQATEDLQEFDRDRLQELAFANRPDYLITLQQLQVADLNVLQASNDRRWNLDLETAMNESLSDNTNFTAELILSRELGNNLQDKENFERAKVNFLQLQNDRAQLEEEIEVELSDRLRDIELRFQQIQLAQEAVKLAEAELEAQEALFNAGRGDAFQLQQAQQTLLTARNVEIDRRIEYLNAIVLLQQSRGTTLTDWDILLETE